MLETQSPITSNCCQTLTSLYGVGIAQHLKKTALFRLPDLQTSLSCLSDFQSRLSYLNLPENLTTLCFRPQQFVNTSNICADIQTKQDWLMVLGQSTSLDTACRPDLSDLTACDACVLAGFRVQSRLLAVDGNDSHSKGCFYYTILYAAGVVNELGPESAGALSCIFGLPLFLQTSSGEWALVVGSVAAGQRPTRYGSSFKILRQQQINFSEKNLIGKGQFGAVYKGKLPDGTVVAVKKVMDSEFQGDAEFCSEVEIISTLKHRNLVPLRAEGSIQTGTRPMTWPQRKSIILDVANALAYLHHGVKPPIYHRDIKPTNILLDSYMRARVGDFGLAKQGNEGESHLTTRIAGTHGYLAPEYALYGN
ncbi:UNVERIFIED_CONTAM: putative receptor-like protein kinase [Sesamum radiatum]|uniref:Receptor-like protein kinase n=1 Tax=Sesamum radiatum TaxID=300843 RepID=A0AAW2MVL2_SESRA